MADETPFNPKSLTDWINVLQNAAAIPKGHADYDEARQVVALAYANIRRLNRDANAREVETPGPMDAFSNAGIESVAGNVATQPVQPALTLLGGENTARFFGPPLEAFLAKIAGRKALDAFGVDPDTYERGAEANPMANAIGEMSGPTIMALTGILGRKPAAAGIEGLWARSKPSSGGALPEINMELTPAGKPGIRPMNSAPVADVMDRPTFLRRAAKPEPPPPPPPRRLGPNDLLPPGDMSLVSRQPPPKPLMGPSGQSSVLPPPAAERLAELLRILRRDFGYHQ